MGYDCVSAERLAGLTDLSRYVAELANLTHDDHLPYVGASAFAHKGGIHVAAMLKHAASYQHVEPTQVGNRQRSVVSELSGRGNLVDKIKQFNLNPESLDLPTVLEQIKQLESQGFTFEGAEASVELMLRRTHPAYVPPFELSDYTVNVQRRRGRGLIVEATVKVRVGPQIMHTVAEGNGPVNALDAALRKALIDIFPQIAGVRLEDYKVRILDGENNTAATTRVLIETRQGARRWSTVGASANIIDASWRALADSCLLYTSITDIRDLPAALKEAFYIARTGRPGPVLVDITKCVQQASMEFTYPTTVNLPGYRPNRLTPDPEVIARAARLLNEAQRPVIVAGQGVSMAGAEAELRQLAEKANIPVATSLLGIGTFPSTHPLSLSWGGMHGEAYCNYALQECDVMFAIGARLDDRLTGAFSTCLLYTSRCV